MNKFKKTYQLWTKNDYGYSLEEYDTLKECLFTEKYTTDFYITKKVDVEAIEIREAD